MRCFRVASGRRIAPFGDLARDLHVGVRTVAEAQAAAVAACGLELIDVDDPSAITERPALVLYDDVWISEMALRQFVAEALRSPGDLQLAVQDDLLAQSTDPLGDLARTEQGDRLHDVAVLVDPQPLTARDALPARTTPWRMPTKQMKARVVLPPSLGVDDEPGSREAQAPITARVVGPVRHWLHLLRLSQLTIGVDLLDALRRHPRQRLRIRLMRRPDPWAVARRLVFIHPTARVHPTADLEAAIIGPDVVVEAHAHVHRSVLGAGVRVGDHAAIMGCTLAEQTQVLRASYLAHCAAMPGATLASYKVQLSLFGERVFLTTSAWLIDAKLRGVVQVEHEGRRVDVGPFLGCCLGHDVTLGAQVLVQAGRAIPNGAVVVGSPERFLTHIDNPSPGTVSTVRNGRLTPL